jgi:hypothetical protein
MRLTIRDDHHQFDRQTHAYAEYRAFSSLVGTGGAVEQVTVSLARRPDGPARDSHVACTVAVRLASGEVASVRAADRHAYAAIDRAVSLVRDAVPVAGHMRVRTRRAVV